MPPLTFVGNSAHAKAQSVCSDLGIDVGLALSDLEVGLVLSCKNALLLVIEGGCLCPLVLQSNAFLWLSCDSELPKLKGVDLFFIIVRVHLIMAVGSLGHFA